MAKGPLTMLPKAALGILQEVSRHVLRRPVTGIAAAARTNDGRWVLIRRADTGTWALPGGTLEWGEVLRDGLARELREEAGIESFEFERLVGVYSRPDRDVRFHAVTVVALCRVALPTRMPMNGLEIREVGMFADADVPEPLAMGMSDMLQAARVAGDGVPAVLE
jgi:8-oxo-dGTP diphosphatase